MAGGLGVAGRVGLGISLFGAIAGGCAQILGADWGSYEGGDETQGGCVDPATDCPPGETECVAAVCESGGCGQQNVAPGTPAASQPAGGCVEVQCDGNGGTVDVPLAEKTACTMDGGAVCNGAGACVECVDGTDCASGACGNASFCVTCRLSDVPANPPSCQSGASGAGNDCGINNNKNCCDHKRLPCGTYLRSFDAVTSIDGSYPATVSDFRLDTYEITVGRFRAFVDAGKGTQVSPPPARAGEHPKIPGSGWDPAWSPNLELDTAALKSALYCDGTYATWTDSPGANEKLPMNCITWYEAFAFCAWDSGRLPTEAEWNYAAAGGAAQREYPWGSGIDSTYAVYGCTGDGSASGQCAFGDILPVGSRSPKGDGLWGQADLGGSMWEWTLDWYSSGYTNPCNDCANAIDAALRVVRGGGFHGNSWYLHAGVRYSFDPTVHYGSVGARCARTQ